MSRNAHPGSIARRQNQAHCSIRLSVGRRPRWDAAERHGRGTERFLRAAYRTAGKDVKESTMGKVTFGLSVSLDGFIASKNDDVSEVFAWMGRAMEHFYEVIGDQLSEGGVVIMGHRSFNQIDNEQGWIMPDGTPLPGPVIVLQSQDREPLKQGQTQYYFVTEGIESAIAKARELAGEKNIALHGGSS